MSVGVTTDQKQNKQKQGLLFSESKQLLFIDSTGVLIRELMGLSIRESTGLLIGEAPKLGKITSKGLSI